MKKILGILAAVLLIGIATGGELSWMDLSTTEERHGHDEGFVLHVELYDTDEKRMISDGDLRLIYYPMLVGHGTWRYEEDVLKNETIQVTKSMFKNGVLKLPQINYNDLRDLFINRTYEVDEIGVKNVPVHPRGVEIGARFTTPSGTSRYSSVEQWLPDSYHLSPFD